MLPAASSFARHPASASFHFASIAAASCRDSADVTGNSLIHDSGLQASMIILEWEVTPFFFSAGGMRGSSAELQALRTISTCSDGSQRVVTAHITSARL